MKTIKIIFIFIFLILVFKIDYINACPHNCTQTSINDVPIGGGISTGEKVIYAVNSGRTYCTDGQDLIIDHANKTGLGRDGTLLCMIRDDEAPIVKVTLDGTEVQYSQDNTISDKVKMFYFTKWTNQNVSLTVEITDTGNLKHSSLGLKKSWYKINEEDVIYTTIDNNKSNFILNFSEEGTYIVTIGAEDKSKNIGTTGEVADFGNIIEITYIVNIDKSAPVLRAVPSTNYSWTNEKHILNFKILDTYKGENIEIKNFECLGLPDNSSWLQPVANDGTIVGICDPSKKDCSTNNNFIPNLTNCLWQCNEGFTKGIDNICYKNEKFLQCNNDDLLKKEYMYDIGINIIEIGTGTVSEWIAPDGISSDGKFLSFLNKVNFSYSPDLNSCDYECVSGYHDEGGKCINNVRLYCCGERPPLTGAIGGNEVDCSIDPESKPQCVESPICGWEKEVLGQWSKSEKKWIFATSTDGIDTLENLCAFEIFPNSDSYTCNPGYFLTYYEGGDLDGKPKKCVRVNLGKWSGQENTQKNCSNKPNNSTYVEHTDSPFTGGNNDCPWICDGDYYKSGSNCVRQSRTRDCELKPSNTIWNSVSSITQYKEGKDRTPSLTPVFNQTASTVECRFKCNINYSWNGNNCIADTKEDQSCTGLIENAIWNNVDKIDQTWDGTKWNPSTIGVYNVNSSTSECRFECNINYFWNGNNCIADTKKDQSCTGLIENAIWNNVDKIDQTWDGTKWNPSTIGVYNVNSSTSECRFKCNIGKIWNPSTETCN